MKRTLLIDADVLCHQMAYKNTKSFSFDGEETVTVTRPEKAKQDTIDYVESIREELKGDKVILVLSDRRENWRKSFDAGYKATRKPKPELWETVRAVIESPDIGYPTAWYPRLEGDDVLGILATSAYRDAVIVSIDKDMQTIPCNLYLVNKPDLGVRPISADEGRRFHLYQTLMGDDVDEYPGCPGIGKKKAQVVIDEFADRPVADLWRHGVIPTYESKGLTEKDALHQARLAYILQAGDYELTTQKVKLWHPRKLRK